MADFKKIDEQDFIFIDKPWTQAEKKAFSEFLKTKKEKKEITKKLNSNPKNKNYI